MPASTSTQRSELVPVALEPIREVLWKLRELEDELLSTELTTGQHYIVNKMRATRWNLWGAIPGLLAEDE